jgi:hypothetical protein
MTRSRFVALFLTTVAAHKTYNHDYQEYQITFKAYAHAAFNPTGCGVFGI